MSGEWYIAAAILVAGVIVAEAIRKGLALIADRIDNRARIAGEIRQELNAMKAKLGGK